MYNHHHYNDKTGGVMGGGVAVGGRYIHYNCA